MVVFDVFDGGVQLAERAYNAPGVKREKHCAEDEPHNDKPPQAEEVKPEGRAKEGSETDGDGEFDVEGVMVVEALQEGHAVGIGVDFGHGAGGVEVTECDGHLHSYHDAHQGYGKHDEIAHQIGQRLEVERSQNRHDDKDDDAAGQTPVEPPAQVVVGRVGFVVRGETLHIDLALLLRGLVKAAVAQLVQYVFHNA